MIAVKIHSGLGNQLFQYAFAWALAKKHSCLLLVDASYCKYYPLDSSNKTQSYHLHHFSINPSQEFEYFWLKTTYQWLPNRILKKLYFLQTRHQINRNRLHYVKDDLSLGPAKFQSLPNFCYLDGYFQYPGIFLQNKKDLMDVFTYKIPSISSRDKDLLNSTSSPVIINLRRKDYLKPENLMNQGICSIEYYRKAISFIKSRVAHPKFFLISDDIPDSLVYLSNIRETFIPLNIAENKHILSDFYLMQKAKYLVIANSSYSWWAAFLNHNKSTIIIAPERWAVNKRWSLYNDAIIPKQWIKL